MVFTRSQALSGNISGSASPALSTVHTNHWSRYIINRPFSVGSSSDSHSSFHRPSRFVPSPISSEGNRVGTLPDTSHRSSPFVLSPISSESNREQDDISSSPPRQRESTPPGYSRRNLLMLALMDELQGLKRERYHLRAEVRDAEYKSVAALQYAESVQDLVLELKDMVRQVYGRDAQGAIYVLPKADSHDDDNDSDNNNDSDANEDDTPFVPRQEWRLPGVSDQSPGLRECRLPDVNDHSPGFVVFVDRDPACAEENADSWTVPASSEEEDAGTVHECLREVSEHAVPAQGASCTPTSHAHLEIEGRKPPVSLAAGNNANPSLSPSKWKGKGKRRASDDEGDEAQDNEPQWKRAKVDSLAPRRSSRVPRLHHKR